MENHPLTFKEQSTNNPSPRTCKKNWQILIRGGLETKRSLYEKDTHPGCIGATHPPWPRGARIAGAQAHLPCIIVRSPADLSVESRSNLNFLARSDLEVVAAGPNLIVEKHLEGDRRSDGLRPAPRLAIDTCQRHSMIPSQSRPFAPQIQRVTKADVNFDIDGGDCAGGG
jgi:hypothetical protein